VQTNFDGSADHGGVAEQVLETRFEPTHRVQVLRCPRIAGRFGGEAGDLASRKIGEMAAGFEAPVRRHLEAYDAGERR
jgi:hypothetical protein